MISEPGTYKAKAVDAKLGYTKGGKEQIAVLFETEQGDRITWFGYFTDKSKGITLSALRACGWTGEYINNLDGIGSSEVELVVVEEPDQNGDPAIRVRWVNRPGGGNIALAKPMDAAQAKAFAEKMRGSIIAHDAQAAASGEAPADDDIPF